MKKISIFYLLVLIAFVWPIKGNTVTLQVTDDTHTKENKPNQINGNEPNIIVRDTNIGREKHAFLRFDLSTIPTGNSISKATLRLWVNSTPVPGFITLHQVQSSWDESTLTFATSPLIDLAFVTVDLSSIQDNSYVTVDVTDIVRDWYDGTLDNNGIAILPDSISIALDSKENIETSHPNQLEVVLSKWSESSSGINYNEGLVGIGTTRPSTALEVNGTVTASSFVGDGSGLTDITASETDPTVLASVKDGVDWSELTGIPVGFDDGVDDEGSGGNSDWAISGNDMYSTVSGNVGIGTTSPDSRLDVDGILEVGIGMRGVQLQSTAPDNFRILTNRNIPNPNFLLGYGDGVGGIATTVLRADATGKVTVPGGVDAGVSLLVSGGSKLLGPTIIGSYAAPAASRLELRDDFIAPSTSIFVLSSGETDSDRFFVAKGNGNIGIGTTTPSEKLEVSGTVKAIGFVGDGSELTGIEVAPDSATGLVTFLNEPFQRFEGNNSDLIDPGLGAGPIRVVLARQRGQSLDGILPGPDYGNIVNPVDYGAFVYLEGPDAGKFYIWALPLPDRPFIGWVKVRWYAYRVKRDLGEVVVQPQSGQ